MSNSELANLLTKRELFNKQVRTFWVAAVALGLVLAIALPLAAESAKSLYKKGRDAEARQDVEAAYAFYKAAYDQKPKELSYRSSYNRMRFEAAAKKVSRGQMLREQGQLDAALAEFQKAAEIDSSSAIAQQEIKRTQEMIQRQQNPAQSSPQSQAAPVDNPIKRRLAEAQGPVELQAISDQPITLKMTEDTKVIYETIGKLAGINVLFDPDYTSRRIKIELNGVTLPEALEIVAFESKTFWRPITSNSVFVAADTTAKRKELEQSVVKTFYLSNVSQPTELQDIVNAMRTILEINRIQQLPSQGAIVVRGTPDQVALADKLIGDIDKAKSEVIVDVAIMQVQKGKLQTLGIQPPASVTASYSTPNNVSGGSSNGSTFQLGAFKGFNPSENIALTIGTATANFLYNDTSTKIIQNPQIRALDGQKASLKIGDRVPVATGSFQPGIGGVGINPLVNTQFQYIDVGVNIDITPRIHANREVTLKMTLDISAVTRTANIGGIEQPVIGQRKIEHEIRLKEGEVNLLGGILENSDVKNLTGIPGLAQVPFLKYFFASDHKEKNDNEIVFMLTPHIVRSQDITELNSKSIDVGSGSAIELRRAPARPAPPQQQPPPQQPAVSAPAPQQNQPQPQASNNAAPNVAANQPPPAQPEPSAAPAPAATADRAMLNFDPATTKQAKGQTFTVNVQLSSQQQMHSFSVQLQYDPKLLQLANISNGGFLSSDGQAVAIVHRDDPVGGKLQITGTRPPGSGGVSGNGSVFTLTFVAKAPGETTIAPIGLFPRDEAGSPIMMSAGQATVSIQ
jgi:general secretion pathway protein D